MDPFLLAGTPLETHIARYAQPEGGAIQVCAVDTWRPSAQRRAVLLVRMPHVPQDVIRACRRLEPDLLAGVHAVCLVDPAPSLTLSLLQKALDAEGLQHIAKPAIILGNSQSRSNATVSQLLQLADPLATDRVPLARLPNPNVGGPIVVAIARDAAFCPRFSE
jgi:hypothetical protein